MDFCLLHPICQIAILERLWASEVIMVTKDELEKIKPSIIPASDQNNDFAIANIEFEVTEK